MATHVPLRAVMRLLGSPDLVRLGVRNGFRKRVTSQFDYYWRDGQSGPPVQLDIKMADACNLRCRMCAQWGENGYNFVRPAADLKETVPLAVYKRVVDDLSEVRPWVYIHGGEPFLYPDLVPLLAYMKEKNLTVSVVTNGTLVEKHAARLVEMAADVMVFSVDGPREVHDRIRGYEGAFDSTVGSIRSLLAERRRVDRLKPYVALNSVVTADNQESLLGVYELAEELEVDMVLTHYGWFQTVESGMRHAAILEANLGVTPWSWKGWVWSVEKIDPHAVAETVRRIKARPWSFLHEFVPELRPEEIARYYSDHAYTFGRAKCVAPWVMAEIMPNGDVVSCRDYPDVVAGNIKERSILDLWNSEGLRRFRLLLKQHGGTLPVCSRCPGLLGK